jgi:hypothetical protein
MGSGCGWHMRATSSHGVCVRNALWSSGRWWMHISAGYPRSRDLPPLVKTSNQDHSNVVGCHSTPCPPGYPPAAGRSGNASERHADRSASPRYSSASASAATTKRSTGGRRQRHHPTSPTCCSWPTPWACRSLTWCGERLLPLRTTMQPRAVGRPRPAVITDSYGRPAAVSGPDWSRGRGFTPSAGR